MKYCVSRWSHFFMVISCGVGFLISILPAAYPKMDPRNWYVFGPIGVLWLLVSAKTLRDNLSAYVEIRHDGVLIAGKKTQFIPFDEIDRVGAHNGFVFLVMQKNSVVRLPVLYEKQSELFEHLRSRVR